MPETIACHEFRLIIYPVNNNITERKRKTDKHGRIGITILKFNPKAAFPETGLNVLQGSCTLAAMSELEPFFQRGQIHIWKVPLPLPEPVVSRLKENLNFEERERSGRFHFVQDQLKYMTARGSLRAILGSYLNERPDTLRFEYGAYGKPLLLRLPTAYRIDFNLSHCGDMAVIGVASRRRIGVDVETIRKLPELKDIARQYFSREERAFIASADGEAKGRLFFHFWTRREAAAKARGLDISAALSDLEIPFYPLGSEALLEQEGGTWSIHDLQLGPAHIGAVCAEGESCDVIYRDFDP